jgi:hypothetical protein
MKFSDSSLSDSFKNNNNITPYIRNDKLYVLDNGKGTYNKELLIRYLSTYNNMVFSRIVFDEKHMSDSLYEAFVYLESDMDKFLEKSSYIYIEDNTMFYEKIKEYFNDAFFKKKQSLPIKDILIIYYDNNVSRHIN